LTSRNTQIHHYTTDTDYANNESQGVIANQTEFYKDLSGLTKGQIYFYNTKANNSAGWDDSGGVQTFLTKPDPPSSLTAQTSSTTSISLTWSQGTGYNTTYIERNATAVSSWSRGEGDLTYNSTGTSYTDTNCTEGVTYYYQAWTYANWTYNPTLTQWSDDNDSASNKSNSRPIFSNPNPGNGSKRRRRFNL